jgi:hypothetical protein
MIRKNNKGPFYNTLYVSAVARALTTNMHPLIILPWLSISVSCRECAHYNLDAHFFISLVNNRHDSFKTNLKG